MPIEIVVGRKNRLTHEQYARTVKGETPGITKIRRLIVMRKAEIVAKRNIQLAAARMNASGML